jgi:uncharacterized protein YecT (DUF1311 family)
MLFVKANGMRPLLSIAVTVALSTFVYAVHAQDDLALGCSGPDTSSVFESCVLEKKIVASEMKLQVLYQLRLKAAHSKTVALSLLAAQTAWEKYREKTCQYEQAEYGGINSINAVRCNERMADERVRYFESLR